MTSNHTPPCHPTYSPNAKSQVHCRCKQTSLPHHATCQTSAPNMLQRKAPSRSSTQSVRPIPVNARLQPVHQRTPLILPLLLRAPLLVRKLQRCPLRAERNRRRRSRRKELYQSQSKPNPYYDTRRLTELAALSSAVKLACTTSSCTPTPHTL